MNSLILLFWCADILNLPFMEVFDTTYPLNDGFWCLAFIILVLFSDSKK